MKMNEPKVVFVPVDLSIVTVSSVCDQVNTKSGSVETCTGPEAPGNNCCDGNPSFSV